MVAGECSVVAGVIVTCILAVLSGLCLVLALIFFIYARRKLEQITFLSSSATSSTQRAMKKQLVGGSENGAYLADDLNMQEAGCDQIDGALPYHAGAANKNGIPGYTVCLEFFQNGHEKWSNGLPHDKFIYRLMANDVNFEARRDDDGASYLAFAGVKGEHGCGKLLKPGDRVHALMLNCSALLAANCGNGKDEAVVELLLKLLEHNSDRQAVFVDVAASLANERLVDADVIAKDPAIIGIGNGVATQNDAECCVLSKEHEMAACTATAEMRQGKELSTSESKDSGREETRTNSEHENGVADDASSVISSGDCSPQPMTKDRRSNNKELVEHLQQHQQTSGTINGGGGGVLLAADDVVVAVDLMSASSDALAVGVGGGEAIELAQHPSSSSLSFVFSPDQLPLPAPDLLRTPPSLHSPPPKTRNGDARTKVNVNGASSSSPQTSPITSRHHLNNGGNGANGDSSHTLLTTHSSKIDAYMAL